MRDYGKVHTSFWASETLRDLDADAKLLALYLLTSPHTHMAGVFSLPSAYASHDMGWTSERLSNGFATLVASGWLKRCDRTEWVWIVKFAKFNTPDNPNQRKAIAKQFALVPENCSFKCGVSEPLYNGYVNPPTPTPTPVASKKKKKDSEQATPEHTLHAWIETLDGADAVPAADPLFGWAAKQGIPADWLAYAWAAFEDRYTDNGKTYADWRASFRTHVKRGWLDIWRLDARSGGFVLTTAGEQWRREVQP